MRRLALTLLVALVAGGAALLISTVAQGSDTYKFDVIFDDARGLVSGQEVKIAGAVAGEITNVTVTTNNKARVEASIHGPFQMHTDASCIIRPDGLIAENYLDCDPGSTSKPLLRGSGGLPPTVPVTQTTEPVELLDLFNIFNLPTRERFQVLIDELGITTAGNGDQINAILQRANPTLEDAQRVIAILDRQDQQIAAEITNTNTLAASGTAHIADVQNFIRRAANLTALTSSHASPTEQAIHRLPGFLAAATPAMAQLNTVADDGTPLLKDIRTAVPYLNRLDSAVVPFTRVAAPNLASLSSAVGTAIPDLTKLTPVVRTIGTYLKGSATTTSQFSGLLSNLVQRGFSENFLSVLYYVATSLSKYDATSHMLSTLLLFPNNGGCSSFATTPTAGCSAHYGSDGGQTPARTSHVTRRHTSSTHSGTSRSTGQSTGSTTTSPSPSTTSGPNLGSSLGSTLSNLGSTVSGGVSTVTGVGTRTLHGLGALSGGTSTSSPNASQTSTSSLSNLLGYLLK